MTPQEQRIKLVMDEKIKEIREYLKTEDCRLYIGDEQLLVIDNLTDEDVWGEYE